MSAATITQSVSTLCLGQLALCSHFVLSPLAGYTNWPLRRALRELGGLGLATTELVNARALLRGSRKSLEFIETCPLDRPLAVQIYGSVAQEMADAARWLENFGVDAVDINMGCPVHKVTRGGGGSALMCDVKGTVSLVRTVVEAVRIPVTVKMRLGWDDANWSILSSPGSSSKSAWQRSSCMVGRASRVSVARSNSMVSVRWSRQSSTSLSLAMATFAPRPTLAGCLTSRVVRVLPSAVEPYSIRGFSPSCTMGKSRLRVTKIV